MLSETCGQIDFGSILRGTRPGA